MKTPSSGRSANQLGPRPRRQHDDAVLISLALANQNLVALAIDILDAQAAALKKAHAGSVHEPGHQQVKSRAAFDGVQHLPHFRARQDDRQALAAPGPHCVQSAQLHFEHLLVEEDQGIERLRLRACRHLIAHGQVGQVFLQLAAAHFRGMPFVMKEDVALDPLHVTFFGAQGIVPDAQQARTRSSKRGSSVWALPRTSR